MVAYDVGIIGLGTMGSLTALELARRGQKVIGFDTFAPPHDQGSHTGDTRIFRTAYAEHPDYVPLALRAGELWDRLGEELDATLLNRTGMLTMGEPQDPFLAGIRRSATLHQLAIETLSASEIRRRFPALAPPEEFVGMLETTAGWVDVNESLKRSLAKSGELGVRIELLTRVSGWERDGRDTVVRTQNQSVRVGKLVVTAGSWVGSMLKSLALPLTIRRKVLAWFAPERPEWLRPEVLPVFAFAPNLFYGFPNIRDQGVKVAEHMGGQEVENPASPVAEPDKADLEPLVKATLSFLPGVADSRSGSAPRLLSAKTCLYTMTPDEHFIIDQHPLQENIFLAAGFSGHGFKFAPVVAEALSDLVLEGKTSLPVDFLSLRYRNWRPAEH
jgi:monomeric sarcosine oxidase